MFSTVDFLYVQVISWRLALAGGNEYAKGIAEINTATCCNKMASSMSLDQVVDSDV